MWEITIDRLSFLLIIDIIFILNIRLNFLFKIIFVLKKKKVANKFRDIIIFLKNLICF